MSRIPFTHKYDWTREEVAVLDYYPVLTPTRLSRYLPNRTIDAIKAKLVSHDVKRVERRSALDSRQRRKLQAIWPTDHTSWRLPMKQFNCSALAIENAASMMGLGPLNLKVANRHHREGIRELVLRGVADIDIEYRYSHIPNSSFQLTLKEIKKELKK